MLWELRPSARRRRRAIATASFVYAAFTLIVTAIGGATGLLIALSLCVVALAAGYVYLRRSRIVVTPAEIAVTGLFRTRRQPLDEVTSVVRATLVPPRGPVVPTLFLIGGPGPDVLLRITVTHYESYDVDQLLRHLGRPAIEHDRPMTAARLADEHPGIVPLAERRPYSSSFAVRCGIVVLVIAIGLLGALLTA